MAVANSIKKTSYPNVQKQILVADEIAFTLGAVIGATGVTANEQGRKILKAGTPVAGDILDRNKAFTKGSGSNAIAILLHDVDVTDGDANGTIVIFGFVDLLKLDEDVQELIDETMIEQLSKITFIKGE